MRIKGEAAYTDAADKWHEIKGAATLPDETVLKKLRISRKIHFENISCDKLDVEGKCRGGFIKAKNFFAEGSVKVDEIKIDKNFELEGKIKSSEIEADEITIESRHGSIGNIKCRTLKIFDSENEIVVEDLAKLFGERFFRGNKNSRLRIRKIFAEKVSLENCEVDEIKCKDAFIGSNCIVEKLFVANREEISVDSQVGEIIHENFEV